MATFLAPPSGWYLQSFQGHLAFPPPSPLICSLPSSIASCSAPCLAVWAEPHLIPLHWCAALRQLFPHCPLLFHTGQGRAPCLLSVKMAVRRCKDQNASQMIVAQQVTEEGSGSLPSSRGTPTPWLMLGLD